MRTDYKQLEYLHIILRTLLAWLERETGLEFTETSSYRDSGTGVHTTMPCRGYDLRMRNKMIGQAICDFINSHWIYDPRRPDMKCAIIHGEGSNLHIHVQVHPNTEKDHVSR